ncbi:uncharacterized protein N7473_002067 [Penicillium subrubescens]|uniref:uncharacterized protein n=1 Tax=Penicillium subrubescens TaxID=1316194 RepID=UPI0025450775|nr:uncharacterized protein N7473_002067 [Penicillium subrubescens]KAJ5905151.1 hypothetical protein N7473_002067 [Penicillium subrubescens]
MVHNKDVFIVGLVLMLLEIQTLKRGSSNLGEVEQPGGFKVACTMGMPPNGILGCRGFDR